MPPLHPNTNRREDHRFGNTPCLTWDELIAHHHNDLTPEQKRRVETHLAECELCALAVENFPASVNEEEIRQGIAAGQTAIRARVQILKEQHEQARQIVAFSAFSALVQRVRSHRFLRYSAILSVVLLFTIGGTAIYKLLEKPADRAIDDPRGDVRRAPLLDFWSDADRLAAEASPADKLFLDAKDFAAANQLDSAMVRLQQAAEQYQRAAAWEMGVRCLNALAEYSRRLERYEQARDYVALAIRLGKARLGDAHGEVLRSFRISASIPHE